MAERHGAALLGKGYGVMDNLRAAGETRHAMRHVTYVKCDGTDSACGWSSISIPGRSKGSSSNKSGNRRWQQPHYAKRAIPANHSIPCHRC
jgi:hypothetical protein